MSPLYTERTIANTVNDDFTVDQLFKQNIDITLSFVVLDVVYGVDKIVSIRIVFESETKHRLYVIRDDCDTYAIRWQIHITDDSTDECHIGQPVEVSNTSGFVQHEYDVSNSGASFINVRPETETSDVNLFDRTLNKHNFLTGFLLVHLWLHSGWIDNTLFDSMKKQLLDQLTAYFYSR